jgi:hypothetical protein
MDASSAEDFILFPCDEITKQPPEAVTSMSDDLVVTSSV